MPRTTIRRTVGNTDYLATWIPLNKMIILDRGGKFYATISNMPTFEDAQAYMEQWFAYNAPERQ